MKKRMWASVGVVLLAVGLLAGGSLVMLHSLHAEAKKAAAAAEFKSVSSRINHVTVYRNNALVTREVDGGLQTVKLKSPAIVTTDLRLNEPRYASLPNIMKAKKKPIDEKTPEAYGVDIKPRLEVLKTVEPARRKGGIKVASVAELVSKLKNEAGVL